MNKSDLRDDIDRDCALVRPTGRDGIAQSGLSKLIDHSDGNNRLIKVAKVLARAEQDLARMAMRVIWDGEPAAGLIARLGVEYPADFDLFTASDVAAAAVEFQTIVDRAGALPRVEGLILGRLLRLCMPGMADAQYAECDREIGVYLSNRMISPRQGAGVRGQGSSICCDEPSVILVDARGGVGIEPDGDVGIASPDRESSD
jgi:hypothetical protein